MRKGGFNMYLCKEKSGVSFYKGYQPKFLNHKDTEIQAYVAHTIGSDMSKRMKSTVRCMTDMIVAGFSKGGH